MQVLLAKAKQEKKIQPEGIREGKEIKMGIIL